MKSDIMQIVEYINSMDGEQSFWIGKAKPFPLLLGSKASLIVCKLMRKQPYFLLVY